MSARVSQYFHLTQLIQQGVHRPEDRLTHVLAPTGTTGTVLSQAVGFVCFCFLDLHLACHTYLEP